MYIGFNHNIMKPSVGVNAFLSVNESLVVAVIVLLFGGLPPKA
jgi:hypothetical protein